MDTHRLPAFEGPVQALDRDGRVHIRIVPSCQGPFRRVSSACRRLRSSSSVSANAIDGNGPPRSRAAHRRAATNPKLGVDGLPVPPN